MKKFSLKDLDVSNKRVFVRVDFNVPLDNNGNISDDTRIRRALPTIQYIIDRGGIPILASHLGRPKGKKEPKLSLRPVAQRLSTLLNRDVTFLSDCIGKEVKETIDKAKPGDVILLENLRFHPEEKENDENFAKSLASLADLYVNDAFGTAHRAHASIAKITEFFLAPAAGFLMEKEIENLSKVLFSPTHPFIAIIGGKKISDKLGVIENLLDKVDSILLGGGLIFNFFKAKGYEIGNSIFEEELIERTYPLLKGSKIHLPVDVVIGDRFDNDANQKLVKSENIPEGWWGMDIGEETIKNYKEIILRANTIIWAGPMGVFEFESFAKGTKEIGEGIARATERGATSVVGGGDTLSALKRFGLVDKITHVSTGGGASLEFLEGKELPGIKALRDKG